MTGQLPDGLRELPIRVPVASGESLHSWIEALAARYRMTVREILPALGIPAPRTPYGLIAGTGSQALRTAERLAGLPDGRLDNTVLGRYSALGLVRPRRGGGAWQTTWARMSGSRFCPRCLAGTGGRWMLAWNLNWTFACRRHSTLLAARCGACGGLPRAGENRLDHVPDPLLCSYPGTGKSRCGAPLAEVQARELPPGHPLIACQEWIDGILALPAQVTVAGLRVPPRIALAALASLMRHAIAAGGLSQRHVERLLPGPAVAVPPPGPVPGMLAPVFDSPALFGAAAVLASGVLLSPSVSAAAGTAARIISGDGLPAGPDMPRVPSQLDQAATRSPLVDAIMLRARAPVMGAADRLAFRTESAVPRRPPAAGKTAAPEWPFRPGIMTSVPARLVPQVAWKSLAETLGAGRYQDTAAFTAALSMAVIHCGTDIRWTDIAASLKLPRQYVRTAGYILSRLASEERLDHALACIDALVEELTQRPPPIDYARRRHVFRNLDLLTPSRLRRALHSTDLILTRRRRRHATMLMWETLTGGDIRFAGGSLAPLDHRDRHEYSEFRALAADGLSDYLALEGERLLLRERINEPVTWQPEPAEPGGLRWRSPPPDMTRRLPGWGSPSRQNTLRRSARDHTPRGSTPPAQYFYPSPTCPAEVPRQHGRTPARSHS